MIQEDIKGEDGQQAGAPAEGDLAKIGEERRLERTVVPAELRLPEKQLTLSKLTERIFPLERG